MTASEPPAPAPGSLWDAFPPETDAGTRGARGRPEGRRLRWVVGAALPAALTVVLAVGVLLPPELPPAARAALFAFGLAVILWSTTRLNAAFVAVGCALLLVLIGGAAQEKFFEALASDVVWLMFGAFILGEAVRVSGLAGRLTDFVVARARSVRGVAWWLSAVLLPLTFLIPSTSGRAAVMLPVFRALTLRAGRPEVTRALALLIPAIILVSTAASLVGAGSHVLTVDLLRQKTGEGISFGQWALWGLPFALVATALTVLTVLRLFLPRELRSLPLAPAPDTDPAPGDGQHTRRPLRCPERLTLAVTLAMVGLWLTERWHGLEIATVAVLGALLLAAPGVGVLPWKAALKSVSWNLLLFVGAALVLGTALIDSGAAEYLVGQVFALSGLSEGAGLGVTVLALAFVTLTSHLYMTSHAARAAALTPPLLLLAAQLELNPVAVVFIGTVGLDYCLTFPVSSKALLLFSEQDEVTFTPPDLLRLSAALLPLHAALMVATYFLYWRHVGLAL